MILFQLEGEQLRHNFFIFILYNVRMDIIKPISIKNKIYEIQGKQVMLDRDLAQLYCINTRVLKQSVKRNLKRFPTRFMFKLNEKEIESLVSKFVIPSKSHLGGAIPYAFTEQGIAMLSAILRSDKAINVSIQIIDAFVNMRRYISSSSIIDQRVNLIENRQLRLDDEFNKVLNSLNTNMITPKQGIFYKGQVFDAYVFVQDLITSAEKSIVVIDNYIDDSIIKLLSNKGKSVSVVVYTRNISDKLLLSISKFNEQYGDLKVKEINDIHDRFIILDNKSFYHIGASLKDLGKKLFAFSKLEECSLELSKFLDGF